MWMFVGLAVLGGMVGLFATGAALFTAWVYHAGRRRQKDGAVAAEAKPKEAATVATEAGERHAARTATSGIDVPLARWLLRWTVFDYAVLVLFAVGAVFLLADLFGAYRDRGQFPPYHFAYLLSGFVFSVMGMLFAFVRLLLVLKLSAGPRTSAHHQHEPSHARHAE